MLILACRNRVRAPAFRLHLTSQHGMTIMVIINVNIIVCRLAATTESLQSA
jgi:hypothetical protein